MSAWSAFVRSRLFGDDDAFSNARHVRVRELINSAPEKPAVTESRRVIEWLRDDVAAEALFTIGIPGRTLREAQDPLSETVLLWPKGFVDAPLSGFVSSRLGQSPEKFREWFDALRTAMSSHYRADERVLLVEGTAAVPYVKRCAELFGRRTLHVTCDETSTSISQWLDCLRRGNQPAIEDFIFAWSGAKSLKDSSRSASDPLRDRIAVHMPDRLRALYVRAGGNVSRLMHERLRCDERASGNTWLLSGASFEDKETTGRLVDTGAIPWLFLEPTSNEPVESIDDSPNEAWPGDGEFLTHCTRRSPGPWPNQQENEFLDDLLLDRPGKDHSAFATLCRIIAHRKIIASSKAIRGGHDVVSFTAVPPCELPDLRKWQKHRRRWDFEPYGICIRKDVLLSLGARRVIYGDEQIWSALADKDKPFFQIRRGIKGGLEWTHEREWRVRHDVDLNAIPPEAAMIFVPSRSEARQLIRISPWPVKWLSADTT